MSDWLDIHTQFNTETDSLEILAIGESGGNALKATKNLSYKEIK